ncbi:formylglycine-generating enzyme family protein [Blastopirellula marina]|uniref:Formylglycine-generating enzyme family protein n=1 Tax=Blastopirellula marina TaxID=124 RepID=A0A2S8GTM9_9BACT|nr:formylglycine-generating enzyme family protein [Blastopirellula marina]PQO47741.1 formylglycine-generating enzyme family protein [Blastopirellula marina]
MPASFCLLLALVAAPNDEATLKTLTQFRSEFVAITPGEDPFPRQMIAGSSQQPTVTTPALKPFAICKYETTQELYEAVIGGNPSRWKGPRNSVEMTSLADAEEFCEKATKLLREAKLIDADQELRLPTDDEWEYCCRAGTGTTYSFGDDAKQLDDYAWYTGNAAGNDPPVGVKKPNTWGLYDMHGYIAEWTKRGTNENGLNMTGHVRGGSWKSTAGDCVSAAAAKVSVTTKDDAIGFRCVLAKVPKP